MAEVNKSIWIDAEPDVVFRYFTDSEKMAKWCGLDVELDPVPEGIYRVDMGVTGVVEGRFLSVKPPNFVSIEISGPSGSDAPPSLIEVSITPEAGGSRVDFKQSGLQPPFDVVAPRGLDHHLARLSVAATGGTPGKDPMCARKAESFT